MNNVPKLEAVKTPPDGVNEGAALAALAEHDPTGGLKYLDCRHGFAGMTVVGRPALGPGQPGQWLAILHCENPCPECGKRVTTVINAPIHYCPLCGEAADRCPTRNYIIGQNPLLDRVLLRRALFAEAKV